MAAKTFDEWDCIKDCSVEDRQCPRCEEAWKAATAAAEEKFNSTPSANQQLKAKIAEVRKYIENMRSSKMSAESILNHVDGTLRQLSAV